MPKPKPKRTRASARTVINPLTGRRVRVGGPAHRAMRRRLSAWPRDKRIASTLRYLSRDVRTAKERDQQDRLRRGLLIKDRNGRILFG